MYHTLPDPNAHASGFPQHAANPAMQAFMDAVLHNVTPRVPPAGTHGYTPHPHAAPPPPVANIGAANPHLTPTNPAAYFFRTAGGQLAFHNAQGNEQMAHAGFHLGGQNAFRAGYQGTGLIGQA